MVLFQEDGQEKLCDELFEKWGQSFGKTTQSKDKSTGITIIIMYISVIHSLNCMFSSHLIQNAVSN